MRAAVLGSPIAHSLSPTLHRAASAALGLAGFEYGRFEVVEDALPAFLAAHPEHVGFSLTMPLKHALLRLAAEHDWEIDPEAARTGAGNTLVRHADGTRRVLNTDVAGIVRALSDAGVAPAAPGTRTAAVLGGGATAASATAALAELGVADIAFAVRSAARAADVFALADSLGMRARTIALDAWEPGATDLAVSTLPAGALAVVPVTWPESFDRPAALLDVAYARAEPDLLSAFAARGGTAVPGTRMLVHQAAEQFRVFAAAVGVELGDRHRRIVDAMLAALPEAPAAR